MWENFWVRVGRRRLTLFFSPASPAKSRGLFRIGSQEFCATIAPQRWPPKRPAQRGHRAVVFARLARSGRAASCTARRAARCRARAVARRIVFDLVVEPPPPIFRASAQLGTPARCDTLFDASARRVRNILATAFPSFSFFVPQLGLHSPSGFAPLQREHLQPHVACPMPPDVLSTYFSTVIFCRIEHFFSVSIEVLGHPQRLLNLAFFLPSTGEFCDSSASF